MVRAFGEMYNLARDCDVNCSRIHLMCARRNEFVLAMASLVCLLMPSVSLRLWQYTTAQPDIITYTFLYKSVTKQIPFSDT